MCCTVIVLGEGNSGELFIGLTVLVFLKTHAALSGAYTQCLEIEEE